MMFADIAGSSIERSCLSSLANLPSEAAELNPQKGGAEGNLSGDLRRRLPHHRHLDRSQRNASLQPEQPHRKLDGISQLRGLPKVWHNCRVRGWIFAEGFSPAGRL